MSVSVSWFQQAYAVALRGFMVVVVACGASVPARTCHAGLGETEDEILERYGKPVAELEVLFDGSEEKGRDMLFDHHGMVVVVRIHRGKSVEERMNFLEKEEPVPIAEKHLPAVEAFLATNTNGPAWKRVPYPKANVMRYSWARQDDKALAWVSNERPFLLKVVDATSIVNKGAQAPESAK